MRSSLCPSTRRGLPHLPVPSGPALHSNRTTPTVIRSLLSRTVLHPSTSHPVRSPPAASHISPTSKAETSTSASPISATPRSPSPTLLPASPPTTHSKLTSKN